MVVLLGGSNFLAERAKENKSYGLCENN